jgi:ribosome-associated protein
MVIGAQTNSVAAAGSIFTSRQAAYEAANAAEAKKSLSTLVLDVRKVTGLADFFVICEASSQSQARAIVGSVEKTLLSLGFKPMSIEGKTEGRWVLMDFGSVMVHVFQEHERTFYNLEKFWNHALIVDKASWSNTKTIS